MEDINDPVSHLLQYFIWTASSTDYTSDVTLRSTSHMLQLNANIHDTMSHV